MKNSNDIDSFVFCCYNSLTLVCMELYGRYYGGGVLELTPNEFKSLPIPLIKINSQDFNHLDKLLRNNSDINEILDFTDDIILIKGHSFTKNNIKLLRNIKNKLVNRRLK